MVVVGLFVRSGREGVQSWLLSRDWIFLELRLVVGELLLSFVVRRVIEFNINMESNMAMEAISIEQQD